MYAIVKTGGKQYKVTEGTTLDVEKLEGELETTVELNEVLMVQDEAGMRVGTPWLDGVKITATIVSQFKGKKINGFTYKAKKNQRKRYGHRQNLTKLRVDSIQI